MGVEELLRAPCEEPPELREGVELAVDEPWLRLEAALRSRCSAPLVAASAIGATITAKAAPRITA